MVSVFRLPASLQTDNDQQGWLDLSDLDGVRIDPFGMGVLNDGTPFLTQRGLAALCGVKNAHIGTISSQWSEPLPKPRINKIRDILARDGHELPTAHVQVRANNRVIYAYREEISLAVIEYYAFDAGQFCQPEARDNFRVLAKKGFRDAIYESVGYTPEQGLTEKWRAFHDRISLVYHSAPDGFFSIFKESAEVTVTLGQSGIYSSENIVPDISIGKCWGQFWRDHDLEKIYGHRLEYKHYYPDYFPQSVSNPQTPWCYPESSLGEFKRWLREDYIRGGKFRNYLGGQLQKKQIDAPAAQQALAAYKLPPLLTKAANPADHI
ncbi:hypothetical protein [Sphingomonas taxi]|uniref:hypothetical protein n=1 Tax=Sphingomonas taxi TaxID=1549858 RepID=UPI000AA405D7|nr:hypothetical protein [Sphingomonas taxi]